MDGIINILKPSGMTSHDVVSFVRRCMQMKKVGHTGTLDPQAVGVLPVCIGKATKAAAFLTDKDKVYRAELKWGITTDTQDSYGVITSEKKVNISEEIIKKVILSFQGRMEQIPPMHSAVKIKGQKLYELARHGIEIKREPRKVLIYEINIRDIDFEEHTVLMDVKCGKGTYIRTLCHDIGEKLGCGAHMSFLLRTQSGVFTLDQAVTVEEFEQYCKEARVGQLLIPVDKVFSHLPFVIVNKDGERKVIHGNPVEVQFLKEKMHLIKDETYRVYNEQGVFLCLSRAIKKGNNEFYLKMEKSFY